MDWNGTTSSNPKLQAPNPKALPTPNAQINSQSKAPTAGRWLGSWFGIWQLGVPWDLELGAWNLTLIHLQMKLPQLLGIYRRGRAGHQVDRSGGLGERDDVAGRRLSAQDGDGPIESDRDATVRRGAILERVEEEAEAHLGFL